MNGILHLFSLNILDKVRKNTKFYIISLYSMVFLSTIAVYFVNKFYFGAEYLVPCLILCSFIFSLYFYDGLIIDDLDVRNLQQTYLHGITPKMMIYVRILMNWTQVNNGVFFIILFATDFYDTVFVLANTILIGTFFAFIEFSRICKSRLLRYLLFLLLTIFYGIFIFYYKQNIFIPGFYKISLALILLFILIFFNLAALKIKRVIIKD